MAKMGCAKCGKMMKKGGIKKMNLGGSAIEKAPTYMYGMPQENMGQAGQYGIAKKGGSKLKKAQAGTVMDRGSSEPNSGIYTSPTPGSGMMKKGGTKKSFPDMSGDGKVTAKDILMAKGVIKKPKAKFGATVKVQRSPKAGKVRSAGDQGYAAVGKREPGRIIKKVIAKKK
jgi:hypothetical protein